MNRQELIKRAVARYRMGRGGAATLKRVAQAGQTAGGAPAGKPSTQAGATQDLAARRQILVARALQRVRAGTASGASLARIKRGSPKGIDPTGLATKLTSDQFNGAIDVYRKAKPRVRSKAAIYQGL